MPRKPVLAAPEKLAAFTEMIGEDINDALNHKLSPGEMTIALLVYAATIALHYADIDADEFMDFAAEAWNDRVSRLEEGDVQLPFHNNEEEFN